MTSTRRWYERAFQVQQSKAAASGGGYLLKIIALVGSEKPGRFGFHLSTPCEMFFELSGGRSLRLLWKDGRILNLAHRN